MDTPLRHNVHETRIVQTLITINSTPKNKATRFHQCEVPRFARPSMSKPAADTGSQISMPVQNLPDACISTFRLTQLGERVHLNLRRKQFYCLSQHLRAVFSLYI